MHALTREKEEPSSCRLSSAPHCSSYWPVNKKGPVLCTLFEVFVYTAVFQNPPSLFRRRDLSSNRTSHENIVPSFYQWVSVPCAYGMIPRVSYIRGFGIAFVLQHLFCCTPCLPIVGVGFFLLYTAVFFFLLWFLHDFTLKS